MTHPLQDLDGAKRHIFSAKGKDFFLRVITTPQKFRERQDIVDLMTGAIMLDAQKELQVDLDRSGNRGKLLELTDNNPTDKYDLAERGFNPNAYVITNLDPEELEKYRKSFHNNLDGTNGTVFAVEDAAGHVACATYLTINDPKRRAELQVKEEIGNFVYVDSIMTAPQFRGQNIFSSAFDKIVTMLANPKRHEGQSESFQYAISVTAATELQNDGKQFYHIMNLSRYHKMWSDRFEDLSIVKRQQKIDGDSYAASEPIHIFGEYDEQFVSDTVALQRGKAALEGAKVRGAFLSGVMPSYEFGQEKREALMEARGSKGITRNKTSAHKEGWLEKPYVENLVEKSTGKDQGRT